MPESAPTLPGSAEASAQPDKAMGVPPLPAQHQARVEWLGTYLPWTADDSPSFRPVNANPNWKTLTSRDLWGSSWSKLAPLMADPSLNEIQVQALGGDPRKLTVISDGPRGVLIHPQLEMSHDELAMGLRAIASVALGLKRGVRWGNLAQATDSEAEVFVMANLDDGPRESRLTAVLPPASNAPALAIRRFPVAAIPEDVFVGEAALERCVHANAIYGEPLPTLPDPLDALFEKSEGPRGLPKEGASASYQALYWVMAQFAFEQNIVVFGPTSSGKTSALQTFLNFTNPNKRCVSVQKDANELFLHHINQLSLFCTDNDPMRSPDRILQGILRFTPEILPYGELRGGEAFSFLNAASSGHPGMTTIHAKSALAALQRLTYMAGSGAPAGTSGDDIRKLVYGSANILVHVRREIYPVPGSPGRRQKIRRICGIYEVIQDPKTEAFKIETIFHTQLGPHGLPLLRWTGNPGTLLDSLEEMNLPAPEWLKKQTSDT